MGDKESMKMCMGVVAVISLILLVLGFMDLFKHKPGAKAELGVISQQLRGLGFFLLALVVLSLGAALCAEQFHSVKPSSMFSM